MNVNIYVHFPADPNIQRSLVRIETALAKMKVQIMTAETDLLAAVADETAIDQSIITLLDGLSAQLTAALQSSTPDAAVRAVIATMTTNKTALADAVTRNTPAA